MPTPIHKVPAIEVAGRPTKRNLSRHHLYASGAADVGRVPYQPYTPSVPRRPLGSGPYSSLVLDAFGAEGMNRLQR